MDAKIHKHLSALGFSDYDIRAYVTLLARGPLTGYQLAKVSGIPRPNAYSVLERLKERGAVTETTTNGTAQYQALPAEEMLSRLSDSFQSDVSRAKAALKNLGGAADHPLAWNLKGYEPLIAKAERLIRGATRQVLIGLWPQEAGRLKEALADALKRGVRPTVLCMFGCEQECGGCEGHLYRYPITGGRSDQRSLVLTVDGTHTLVGQIEPDGSAVAAHSATTVLASVTTEYLLNAIAVAEIVRSLGPNLMSILDPGAKGALAQAGLSIDQPSWVERIREVFQKPQDNEGRKS